MSLIDDAIMSLPSGDGSTRRRFVSGLTFVAVFGLHTAASKLFDLSYLGARSGVGLREIVTSTQILVAATFVVFAIGATLVSIVDGYLLPGVSFTVRISVWLRHCPDDSSMPKFMRLPIALILVLVSVLLWPLTLVLCTVLDSFGISRYYSAGLTKSAGGGASTGLDERTLAFYKKSFSPSFQTGLDAVFCNRYQAAWQALSDVVPERHRHWVAQQESRNRDLASITGSAFLALLLAVMVSGTSRFLPGEALLTTESPAVWGTGLRVTTYVMSVLLSYFLCGSVIIAARSTVGILDLAAQTAGPADQETGTSAGR